MYGNNISRSLNALKYFVKQPKYIPGWLYNNLTKKSLKFQFKHRFLNRYERAQMDLFANYSKGCIS